VAVLVAVALDLALGDPPNRVHPVAWLGGVLAAGRRRLCVGSRRRLLVVGSALTILAAALAAGAGAGVAALARHAGAAEPFVVGVALWLLLALRGLFAAAAMVARPLGTGDLPAARHAVGWHLVSRPTEHLDAGQVASATIESVAENLTDAYVAPIVFFLVFGLPGAALYRAVNTADAMIGYRDGALEYFGKLAARLDDLLNVVPARLAALAIVAATPLGGADAAGAWKTLVRDHARTASPNAGWTMAAMAGALRVTLEKPGAYRLGAGRVPRAADVALAVRIVAIAAALATVVLLALAALARVPLFPPGEAPRSTPNAPSRQTFSSCTRSEVVMISAIAAGGRRPGS
jgi:adenosylcobinamide-phosphate synthase